MIVGQCQLKTFSGKLMAVTKADSRFAELKIQISSLHFSNLILMSCCSHLKVKLSKFLTLNWGIAGDKRRQLNDDLMTLLPEV